MIPTRMNPLGAPSYLRRLEYISATGTQYIDTGIVPSSGFSAEIRLAGVLSCGFRQGYMNNEFRISVNNSKVDFAFASTSGSVSRDFSVPRTVRINMDGELYIEGTKEADLAGTIGTAYSFFLFMANSAGSPIGGGIGKIYRAVIRSGGSKIRDFIPVQDKSGVRCMYDTITQKLYYNAGTGDFGGA